MAAETKKGFAVLGCWHAENRLYKDERTAWAHCFSGWGRYSSANQDRMIEEAKASGWRVVPATFTVELPDA